MAYRKLQIRRGLKSKLPLLSEGELGFCSDSIEIFIGDGKYNHKIMDENSTKSYAAPKRRSYTLLIPAVGWSDIAPYTQRIDVQGMVSDGLPLYDLIEFSEQSMEDYAKLTKLETFENAVEVTANFEKPVGNIKIRIEVVY